MKKNKMRLTLRVMAQSSLIWRLKASFNFFCNENDNTRAMMDELMVSRHTLPLLLQTIYFHDEKCRYSFLNYFAKLWNSAQNKAKKFIYNQTKCIISSSWNKPKTMFLKILIFKDLQFECLLDCSYQQPIAQT